MKIKCSKSNLSNALNIVSKAVSTKTTMPILECILVDVYADCMISKSALKLFSKEKSLRWEELL